MKVAYLSAGQHIAVAGRDGEAFWDEITTIERLPSERVYDIEVEGTHNFVGNGIVAHNTYIHGTTTIQGGLLTPSISATGTLGFYTAGAAAPRVVIDASGNVGIGTAGPNNKLEIVGGATAVETDLLQIRSNFTAPNTASTLRFVNSTAATVDNGGGEISVIRGANSEGSMIFRTADVTPSMIERLRIVGTSGNVGIGTTTPGTLLSVHGPGVFTGPLTAFGKITGSYFEATSTSIASTFPIASTTSFSVGNLLTVSGAGTSTFAGGLTTGLSLGVGTSAPSGFYAAGISGPILSGGTGATSTNIGGEDVKAHLRVSSLEILGSCKGCPNSGFTANAGTANRLAYYSAANTLDSANFLATDVTNSFLGIATGTPGTALAVTGAGVITDSLTAKIFKATSTTEASIFPIASTTSFSVADRLWVAGVGTSTIANGLSVTGLTAGGQVLLADGSSAKPALSFASDPDNGIIWSGIANTFDFVTGGTARFRMSNADFMLANGNSFGWQSDVLGSTFDTVLTRDAASTLALRNSTNAQEFRIYNIDSGSNDEFTSLGFINNSNAFGIETEGTGTGTVRPIALLGGFTGISTTSPWGLLSIEHIATSSANQDLPAFVVADQGTSTPSLIVLNRNGFVGIATRTPGTAFGVSGAGSFTGKVTADVFKAESASQASIFPIASSTSFSVANLIQVAGAGTSTFSGGADVTAHLRSGSMESTGDLKAVAGNFSGRVTALNASTTGSASIANLLNVSGAGTSTFSGSEDVTSHVRVGSLEILGACKGCPNAGFTANAGTANRLAYYSAANTLDSANFLAVDTAGSLFGVGTATPGVMLSVHGPALIMGTTTSMGGLLTPSISATGTLGFYTAGAASPRMVIDASGNVGIGVSSPGFALDVSGTAKISGTLTLVSVGGSNTVPLCWGSGDGAVNNCGGGNSVFITSDGKIAIGTSTPGTALGVTGAGVFTGHVAAKNFFATSTSEASIFPIASSTSFSVANLIQVAGAGTSTFTGGLTVAGSSGTFGVGTSSPPVGYAAGIAGRLLYGGSGTSTNIGAEDIRDHLRVSSLEILGACKGCPSGGSGTPGGSDTQVQFNDGGSFGGDAQLTYNKTTDLLTLVNASSTSISLSNLLNVNGAGTSTVSGGLTVATSNGTFGVATATPAALFAVGGNAFIGAGSDNRLTINAGTISMPIFSTTTISDNRINAWSIATSTSATPILTFDTNSPGSQTLAAVGVATITPRALLHVEGSMYRLGGSGDVNGDGTLTSLDSAIIGNYAYGTNEFDVATYARADINGDGRVDMLDADLIANVVVESISIGDAHHGVGKFYSDSAYTVRYPSKNFGIGTTTPGTLLSVHNGGTVLGGPVTAEGPIKAPYFIATSSTASIFPVASTTSFSVANLIQVAGAGTSTFTGGLSVAESAGALGVNTTTPRATLASAGTFLIGGTGATSTTLGGLRLRENLLVEGGIEIIGGCKGCPAGGGSGTPGGADTQVQFNDGGSFGGDAQLTYNKTTDLLTLVNASSTSISLSNLLNVNGAGTSTVSGGLTVATSNGTFGVATATPAALFAVDGNAFIGAGSDNRLTINAGTISMPIFSTTTISDNRINAWSIATSTNAIPLFTFDTNPRGTEGAVVTPFAVGFGTTTPRALLHVEGSMYLRGGSGDATGNGLLAVGDSTSIANYLSGNTGLTAAGYAQADINGDGRVDYIDADLIASIVVGNISFGDAHHRVGKQFSDSAYVIRYPDKLFGLGGTTTPGTQLSVVGAGVITDSLTAKIFKATSTTEASIFPIASSTSFSVANLIQVAGAGTSTFTGGLTTGASFGVASTAPSASLGVAGPYLIGGSGATSTALGGFRLRENLLVEGGIEIIGGCKGCPAGGGSGTPGGSDTQVQFNDGGSFGGDAQLTYNKTTDLLTLSSATATSISVSNLINVAGAGTSTFAGGLTTGLSLGVGTTAPSGFYAAGISGPILYGGAGATSTNIGGEDVKAHLRVGSLEILGACRGCPGAGSGTPGGSSGAVQFNDGAGGFGGSGQLFWDNTNFRLGIGTGTPGTALSVTGGGVFTDRLTVPLLRATSSAIALEFENPSHVIVATNAVTDGLRFATTTANTDWQYPLLSISATTTGERDYARVAVGTTTGTGAAGLRDQFFVAGRINSSWNVFWEDFLGVGDDVQAAGLTGCVSDCLFFNLTFDEVTGTSGSVDIVATSSAAGVVVLDNPTTPAANEEEWLGTAGVNVIGGPALNPVFEARVRTTAQLDHRIVMGFLNISSAVDITDSGDEFTQSAYFRKVSTDNVWRGSVCNITCVSLATSSFSTAYESGFHVYRIELTAKKATFLVDGRVMWEQTTNNLLPTSSFGFYIGNGLSGSPNRGVEIDYIRVWADDPPPGFQPQGIGGGATAASATPFQDPSVSGSIASLYQSERPDDFIEGTVVELDAATSGTGPSRIAPAGRPYGSRLLGVVHRNSGKALGSGNVPVAISGRARAIVSLANGAVAEGDRITSSAIPGVGMRASRPGYVVGRALEAYDPANGKGRCLSSASADSSGPQIVLAPAGGGGGQDCLGVILVELNVGFDMGIGDLVQDIGETIAAIPDAVADLANDAFSNGAELVKIVAGKIVAQTAVVKEFFAGRVAVLPGGDIVLPAGPDQIVGESVFPAGATSILVGNSRVASTTKVFLTPRAQLGAPFAVTELREGQGFVVSTSVAPASDVPFDWLIVTSYRVPADVAAGGSGGVTVISSGGTPSPSPPGIAGSDPAIVPAPPPAGGEMPGEMPSEPPPSEEPTFEPAPSEPSPDIVGSDPTITEPPPPPSSEPAPELAPESPPPPAPIAEPQSPSTTPSPDTASQTSEEPSS